MSRLLLVSPVFHGYWSAIAEALGARGHQVTVCTYDAFRGVGAKVRNKVHFEAAERVGAAGAAARDRHFTARALAALAASAAEVVVVVKGDTLTVDFWTDLGNRPRVIWLYDELRRTGWATRDVTELGPVCSYSPHDVAALRAAGGRATHLPLAFDHRLTTVDPRLRNDEAVLVGARYPERERVLRELAAAGVPVRAFGRDWSRHPVDRLRTWSLHRAPIPWGRDLSRADAYREMAAALAALNLHGDQDGFTMRTFEAPGVGGLHLIDRADLEGLYDPGVEAVTWADTEELVDHCARAAAEPAWADRIRAAGQRRTLAEHTFDHRARVLEETWA